MLVREYGSLQKESCGGMYSTGVHTELGSWHSKRKPSFEHCVTVCPHRAVIVHVIIHNYPLIIFITILQ